MNKYKVNSNLGSYQFEHTGTEIPGCELNTGMKGLLTGRTRFVKQMFKFAVHIFKYH